MEHKTIRAAARRYYNIWQQEKTADIYIYGEITAWPLLESDISSYSLAKDIAGLDADIIHVYINSPGGQVSEGVTIFAALCRHPAKIITHCDGFGCSAASVIFMAGDERYISSLGMLMIHEAQVFAGGNAAELRKAADDLEKISNSAVNAYRGRVKVDDDELERMLAAETWLTAQEALDKGFATGIEDWQAEDGSSMSAKERIFTLLKQGLATEAVSPVTLAQEESAAKNTVQTNANGQLSQAKRKFFNFR